MSEASTILAWIKKEKNSVNDLREIMARVGVWPVLEGGGSGMGITLHGMNYLLKHLMRDLITTK